MKNMHMTVGFMLCAVWLAGGCQINRWQTLDTPHLRLHYRPGSVAAKELMKVVQIYERTYAAARTLLPEGTPSRTVDVYLYDELKERAYAEPEKEAIHIMYGPRYRLTSVHEFLFVMYSPLNPQVPPGIRQGLFKSQSKLRYAMQRRLEDRSLEPSRRWPPALDLSRLMDDPGADADTGMLAGALIRFLLSELGEETFWRMYMVIRADNWREVFQSYLKRDPDTLAADLREYIISRVEQVPGAP
ncbi:MAG: hypothetical protein KC900_02060 [Candidatus Omnitrophica bacterium]|nr:hypothetical protein [Candidatus Omnitrophota bacterium]